MLSSSDISRRNTTSCGGAILISALKKSQNNNNNCGSLYAKCACKCNNNNEAEVKKLLFKTDPEQSYKVNQKRLSIPELVKIDNFFDKKRLSNPEVETYEKPLVVIQPNQRRSSTPGKSTIAAGGCGGGGGGYRTKVLLNHPEINFAIPVKFATKTSVLRQRKISSFEEYEDEESQEELIPDLNLAKMGNGVSLNFGTKKNSACLTEVSLTAQQLQKEKLEFQQKFSEINEKLIEAQTTLRSKEEEIVKLQREIHKLKSVLQQTRGGNDEEFVENNNTNGDLFLKTNSTKKQGVSAESNDEASNQAIISEISNVKFEKDFRSKQLIKDAISENDFLKNLDVCQVREIIVSMYQKEFPAGSYVIKENEVGAHLYVSAEGEFEIIQNGSVLGKMGPGKAFGELAILYNCKRTASIKVVTDSKVWVLDRRIFQLIMMKTGLQRLEDNINFLRSVPLLKDLSKDLLAKISDALEVEFYPAGVHILREGTRGDTFFIISNGSVKVTKRTVQNDNFSEKELRILNRGDYFGEQALLKEDVRTASVISMHPGVECLTLDTESFKHLIGDLSEIKEKSYEDYSSLNGQIDEEEYEYITIDDLDVIATLGVGGFGRVELVQYIKNPTLTFALKCLKKQHIVDTQQQKHVFSERNIMRMCKSQFITRLHKTFKDSKYVYMLLEACLGGEIWTTLRDRGCFDDNTAKFIAGCVIEAFDYLHSRGIIYRDLKPENLLMDVNGYVKLVDFGFSKYLGYTGKTWTFCGTPEYVAPETILNKGHDRAVDYWALGILLHELLTGNPPFTANDPMKIYNLILKGIDLVDFAKHNIGRSAQSLIKKLCRESPSERLGYQRGGIQDIKKHRWFQGFDWDGLVARTLIAPIVQPIRGPCDTSNFDCFSKDNDVPQDENSKWDEDF